MYLRKFEKEKIVNLLRFIHWILQLPQNLETALIQEITTFSEEMKMPYTSNYEEACKELGAIKTFQENILKTIRLRFGEVPQSLNDSILQIQERSVLDTVLEKAVLAESIHEVVQVLNIH